MKREPAPEFEERVSGRGVALYLSGRPIECPICGAPEFSSGEGAGGASLLALFGKGASKRDTSTYVCTRCRYVLLFQRHA